MAAAVASSPSLAVMRARAEADTSLSGLGVDKRYTLEETDSGKYDNNDRTGLLHVNHLKQKGLFTTMLMLCHTHVALMHQ